jgi:uncharacterized protein (DUF983 family)
VVGYVRPFWPAYKLLGFTAVFFAHWINYKCNYFTWAGLVITVLYHVIVFLSHDAYPIKSFQLRYNNCSYHIQC